MGMNEKVRGLLTMPAVVVDGEEYTGAYLAQIVSVSSVPEAEAARTPELLLGLSRVVARAKLALDAAQAEYRHWRDSQIHRVTNNVNAAVVEGFDCAVNPGTDAKGNPKAAKCPPTSVAEVWLRTLPDYRRHWDRQREAEEAWAVLHGALEAAQSRIWCLREIQRDTFGGAASYTPTGDTVSRRPPPPPTRRKG
jgi:hypothetical protein